MVEERNGCLCFDGYTLVKESLDCVPMNGKAVVNTISPNSYGISQKDSDMDKALKGVDFLILDGVYFGLWPLLRYGKKARRITGWDSFIYYLERMQEVGGKVFLLGSTPETLRKMTSRILVEYPAVQVDSYSPPFKPEFDQDDNRKMIEAVNSFSPDILVVGMTAPKQEKWAYFNMPFLHAHVSIAVGNVFDWYAGNTRRPGKFWQKAGLEWFVRIFYRPEIFKRNISNQMVFFRHLALKLLRIKK
ncbi:MAG: WecB/TagA/CpsF family glycosyltransferase [Bacteroidales bacterium]|nr:WecB/TagA/CpsF family glycosyltransferase [Bacteroidales bacterium]